MREEAAQLVLVVVLLGLGLAVLVWLGRRRASKAPPPMLSLCSDTLATTGLIEGLPLSCFPASSPNSRALALFQQGLTLYYAFNMAAACRAFRGALLLDPDLAMAQLGLALASGPTINAQVEDHRCLGTLDAALRGAQAAAARRPLSALEAGLLEALLVRFPRPGVEDAEGYAAALGRLHTGAGRQSASVAALYGESLLALHPWDNWRKDGAPRSGTLEAVAALEAGLRLDPRHLGAHHLLIHATEGSLRPERALASADYLASLGASLPASHLVHMPSHTYTRIADVVVTADPDARRRYYRLAAAANQRAISVDARLLEPHCRRTIQYPSCLNHFAADYTSHDLQSLAVSYWHLALLTEPDAERRCLAASRAVSAHAVRFLRLQPGVERYIVSPVILLASFQRWNQLRALPLPLVRGSTNNNNKSSKLPCWAHITRALWAWGRAMAAVGLEGPASTTYAQQRALFEVQSRAIAALPTARRPTWGMHQAVAMLAIAADTLDATVAHARADCAAARVAVDSARARVAALTYDLPAQWPFDFEPLLHCATSPS